MLLAIFLAAVGAAAAPVPVPSPLAWLNASREAAGGQDLRADQLLSAAAQAWADVLAASGVLDHRGADGSSVLDRYRAVGGTEVRVGEIIGAGPGLAAVENGWSASAEHRDLLLDPAWTDAGWGMSVYRRGSSSAEVWVIVFCQRLVDALSLDATAGALSVRGTFLAPEAVRAALYVGLDLLPPAEWDPRARRFAFAVPASATPGYFRLGYVRADGTFRLTNAFTWPPGTESPGGGGRSSAPAGSP